MRLKTEAATGILNLAMPSLFTGQKDSQHRNAQRKRMRQKQVLISKSDIVLGKKH